MNSHEDIWKILHAHATKTNDTGATEFGAKPHFAAADEKDAHSPEVADVETES
ncbi:MAG: hypothetical protein FWE64_04560 [Alphaproteobacteria bacterium]|nr:hypothetical protein [Alphaproteobacteria bacterium]